MLVRCAVSAAFENLELFQTVFDYAQKQRLVVWADVDKKCFAAKEEGWCPSCLLIFGTDILNIMVLM